jgi:hypothetical protein
VTQGRAFRTHSAADCCVCFCRSFAELCLTIPALLICCFWYFNRAAASAWLLQVTLDMWRSCLSSDVFLATQTYRRVQFNSPFASQDVMSLSLCVRILCEIKIHVFKCVNVLCNRVYDVLESLCLKPRCSGSLAHFSFAPSCEHRLSNYHFPSVMYDL